MTHHAQAVPIVPAMMATSPIKAPVLKRYSPSGLPDSCAQASAGFDSKLHSTMIKGKAKRAAIAASPKAGFMVGFIIMTIALFFALSLEPLWLIRRVDGICEGRIYAE